MNHFQYIQFIPCLDGLQEEPGTNKYSLLPKAYGHFMCQLFDCWYKDFINGERISIRMFDNIVQMLLGYQPESCDLYGHCSSNTVIEGDGSVYPCDFYVLDEWRLGNINEHGFVELKSQVIAQQFVESSHQKDEVCLACEFLNVCRTGCRRHKEVLIDGQVGKSYFCEAYKTFYGYTLSRFKEIARMIYNRQYKG
jgi:uncharacterized protein